MKVTLIADKEKTAIHRLCEYTKKSLPQHEFRIVCFHPKRPSQQQIEEVEAAIRWCDLVDFRYWKSADVIRGLTDVKKPMLLTHYNPYDITKKSWADYKINVVVNAEQAQLMRGQSYRIPLPVDLEYWKFNQDFSEDRMKVAIMVANRIEAKKGVLPVAEATHAAGMKLILVGRPSDPEYLQRVLALPNVEFHEGISDDHLRQLYNRAGIHVCNSVDGFESGTMPILESMSIGVPVLTRRVGHVPDLANGKNMVVRRGLPENVTELVEILKQMQGDLEWMKRMRNDAWYTVKSRCLETYGRKYSQLYWKAMLKKPLVSVVIPTFNRVEVLAKNIGHLAAQEWEHFEVIVCDDGSTDATREFVRQAAQELSSRMTIKYISTALYSFNPNAETIKELFPKTYGIAHARNMGILQAEGQYLLFIDDRLAADPKAIAAFMEHAGEKNWQWGIKDTARKGFVENFSFISRQAIINIGGFSDMITQYGGMTQEVRKRAEINGISFNICVDAQAASLVKSGSRWRKLQDIAKSKAQCYALGYE